LNTRLTRAPSIIFDTQVDHVNIHFSGGNLERTTYEGAPALALPYPTALRRIQRREYYRVEIPLGEPISCVVPYVEPGKPLRRARVAVKALSAGGPALIHTGAQLPHQAGSTFDGVVLTLPELGVVTVNRTGLRVHKHKLPAIEEVVEQGFKFVD